jgi:hypothetical protein
VKIQIIASNSIGRTVSFDASSDKPVPGSIPDTTANPEKSPIREQVNHLLDNCINRLLAVLPAYTRVSFGTGIGEEFAEVYVKPFYGTAFIIEFWQDEETAGPDDIELRLSRYLGDTGVTEIIVRKRIDFSRPAEADAACTAGFDQLLLLAERIGK